MARSDHASRCTVTQMWFSAYGIGMRVWELAEELRVMSSDVLKLIEPYDRYVTSHFANVPRQALDAIRTSPPAPLWTSSEHDQWPSCQRGPVPTPEASSPPLPPRPRRPYRRPPGPGRVTFEPPYEVDDDGYGNDPTGELAYEPIWSTRDVAAYFGVETATVRKWVARGYLHPCGKQGPSHIFECEGVYAAVDAIKGRTNSAGQPAPRRHTIGLDIPDRDTLARRPGRQDRRGGIRTDAREIGPLGTLALHRLAVVSPESLLTTAEAATVIGISRATIRSWVRRGHLAPSRTSTARGLCFRLADVYAAARRG